ncbi:MAG: hypothetical protein JWN81_179 [Solirubrobacterales bacterium]|nr:hypothetical protein [Solirubrobacterales bacterium]
MLLVARLQKTPIPADSPRVNRPLAILEPLLEGEIAIRRQPAGDGRGPAQLDTSREQIGSAATSPPRRSRVPVSVTDFQRIDEYLRAYLEDERFRSAHPLAYGRWLVAWEMLWCADTRARVIAVAHRTPAAMQAFASSLLERCTPLAMDPHWPDLLADGSRRPDPLDGLTSVADAYREQLGEDRSELLGGLLEHWRALLLGVRRHDDRSQPPAERLHWEDGRRLVLFTALVMVEFDRSFA